MSHYFLISTDGNINAVVPPIAKDGVDTLAWMYEQVGGYLEAVPHANGVEIPELGITVDMAYCVDPYGCPPNMEPPTNLVVNEEAFRLLIIGNWRIHHSDYHRLMIRGPVLVEYTPEVESDEEE